MDWRCIVGSCWFVGSVWPTIALGPQNLAQRKEKSTEMIHQQHAETIVKCLFAPQKHKKIKKVVTYQQPFVNSASCTIIGCTCTT